MDEMGYRIGFSPDSTSAHSLDSTSTLLLGATIMLLLHTHHTPARARAPPPTSQHSFISHIQERALANLAAGSYLRTLAGRYTRHTLNNWRLPDLVT